MKKLRIGIIGTGNIGQNAHLPVYMELKDRAEIVACCDLNFERATVCAEKFGIPKVCKTAEELVALPEVDAVDICVWNASHAPVAIAAAAAGKHILCEKPMALNLEHALKMTEAIKASNVTFMMAMPSRYNSESQLLMDLVESGKLGDIYYAKTADIRRRGTPLGWFTDLKKSGGGPVIDIGVHCIDRTWFLMGRPKPIRVSAMTASKIGDYKTKGVSRWIALDSDVTAFDTEDSAAGIIHFENGACMLFEVSWALNAPQSQYTQICGSKGGATQGPLTVYTEDNHYLTDNQLTTQEVNPFKVEIMHFLDCVKHGKTPGATVDDGLTIMRILQGIYDSARLCKEVTL